MQTSTRLSPAQAAKATGVSKSTVTRALDAGEITGFRDPETHRWWIEPVELFRVYPPLSALAEPAQEVAHEAPRTSAKTPENEAVHSGASAGSYIERLKAELDALHREAKIQREERERERRQLEGTISDYRDRLTRAEEKRDEAVTKLTAILTDQREPQRRGLLGLLRRASA